jgi:hypothetical protein
MGLDEELDGIRAFATRQYLNAGQPFWIATIAAIALQSVLLPFEQCTIVGGTGDVTLAVTSGVPSALNTMFVS